MKNFTHLILKKPPPSTLHTIRQSVYKSVSVVVLLLTAFTMLWVPSVVHADSPTFHVRKVLTTDADGNSVPADALRLGDKIRIVVRVTVTTNGPPRILTYQNGVTPTLVVGVNNIDEQFVLVYPSVEVPSTGGPNTKNLVDFMDDDGNANTGDLVFSKTIQASDSIESFGMVQNGVNRVKSFVNRIRDQSITNPTNGNVTYAAGIHDALRAIRADGSLVRSPPPPPSAEIEPAPIEPEPEVKQRRILITRCGFGWTPHSQFQLRGELPKVIIYALEFEYTPSPHSGYTCKAIEIRTGDDVIENLAGWSLYLGTLYNPSYSPLKIPEAHAQITDNVLRLTPDMFGLEAFPCNTVGGISHPLPGVHYVLKTDENILVDTAYSCFVWGQTAWTTMNGVNVQSQRRVSSAALREMETPRLERYILKQPNVYITYMSLEAFTWDRPVLSDWLLPESLETARVGGNAPALPYKQLTTSWGALKKQSPLRERSFKQKPSP